MKLNWFSPLPPAQTDIAHYTRRLLPALTRSAEVTLWTDQKIWDREVESIAKVRTYRAGRLPWADLNRAELTYYNIGNNPEFHGNIWRVSQLLAGVVILHDFRLHNFFDGLYRVQLRDLKAYLSVMTKYYGPDAYTDALACYHGEGKNINYMALRYPLTQLATENALGVVVHSEEAFMEVQTNLHSPLGYIPLPFPSGAQLGQIKEREADARIRLVVFGYIGRNRRLMSILQAIAGLKDSVRFRLDIFGSILNDEKELGSQIKKLKLTHQVRLHGFQTEADLDRHLADCDLAINLRFPTMGEASGSQLRIWAHSLPSLVSKVGWYASLPQDAVAFVSTDENEVADIQGHLQHFLIDPEYFRNMGARGRRELEEHHSPESYAANLVELSERALRFRGVSASLDLAEHAARCLVNLSPRGITDDTFNHVARKIDSLGMRY